MPGAHPPVFSLDSTAQCDCSPPCSARKLTDEQRSAIAAYFAVYKGQEKGLAKLALALDNHPAVQRAYALLRGAFEEVRCAGGVLAMGIAAQRARVLGVGMRNSSSSWEAAAAAGRKSPQLPFAFSGGMPLTHLGLPPPACPCSASCPSSGCWRTRRRARRCWATCPAMPVSGAAGGRWWAAGASPLAAAGVARIRISCWFAYTAVLARPCVPLIPHNAVRDAVRRRWQRAVSSEERWAALQEEVEAEARVSCHCWLGEDAGLQGWGAVPSLCIQLVWLRQVECVAFSSPLLHH